MESIFHLLSLRNSRCNPAASLCAELAQSAACRQEVICRYLALPSRGPQSFVGSCFQDSSFTSRNPGRSHRSRPRMEMRQILVPPCVGAGVFFANHPLCAASFRQDCQRTNPPRRKEGPGRLRRSLRSSSSIAARGSWGVGPGNLWGIVNRAVACLVA